VAQVREFFAERGVLEVETPLLGAAPVSDPHLETFAVDTEGAAGNQRLFLQTSPEYAMKRLLAAGSGPIYQLCKAFRRGEQGRWHNPEFTMLEWYRPGFDHHQLMDEVEELLMRTVGAEPADRMTYDQVVLEHLGLSPLDATAQQLRCCAESRGLTVATLPHDDPDPWLDLLFASVVQPRLGLSRPVLVYDYPAGQAALARIRRHEPPVAERFELFVDGVELANGYHELIDPAEQQRRFELDLERRRLRGLPAVPLDERLAAALDAGLPACAGVAVGFDRLVMLAAGARVLAEVVTFPFERA